MFIEAPGYASGFYVSDRCKPNESERCIFRRFQGYHAYPPTVREAVRDIKEEEANQDTEGLSLCYKCDIFLPEQMRSNVFRSLT